MVVAAGLLLAACGPSPTSDDTGGGDGDGGAANGGGSGDECDTTDQLAELAIELEGLDTEARRAALIERSRDEGGIVSYYGSTNPADSVALIDAFQDSTGISVSHYRASASAVMQRVIEEHAAGHRGADVVSGGTNEFLTLNGEDALAEFASPVGDEVYEGGASPTSIDVYRVMRIAAWNSELISEEDAPTTWEEVLLDFPGQLIYDPGDWDWFGEMVKSYFIGERGLTEDEAVDLFKESARGAVQVSGHTLGTQLMAAGEQGITAVSYHHAIARLPDGAPVAWEPPVGPIYYDAHAVGISSCTARPASALLFLEFFAGVDGQQVLLDGGRTVANTNLGQGFPVEHEAIASRVSLDTLTTERDKWEGLWEEVLRESGSM